MGLASLHGTRLAAGLSLAALIAITISDFLLYRSRRRWQLVADYALSELSSACRHAWVTLAELIGVASRREATRDEFRLTLDRHGDARIVELATEAAKDPDSHRRLQALVAELAATSRLGLATWAPVLVETPYSSALNRYVEFQALLAGLDLVLWEEVVGKVPGPDEPQGPEWVGARVAELIRCGAALERELYPEAAEIDVRAPQGPGPRAAVAS
jgi:hypothetical protein